MQESPEKPFHVGLLIFPGMTQLDMTGPYEVLNRMPSAVVHLIAKTFEPQISEHGLPIQPTTTFETCPHLHLIVIPGGFGINELLLDEPTLDFVRRAAEKADYVGSVCTGALLLGAAGLLVGRRATTHWMSLAMLSQLGAIPVAERVVVDGWLVTGGGITAGIDFALEIVSEISGRQVAEEIQLAMEYEPAPPFDSGSPQKATPATVESLKAKWSKSQATRLERVKLAGRKLNLS